jgi:hypothetical protein
MALAFEQVGSTSIETILASLTYLGSSAAYMLWATIKSPRIFFGRQGQPSYCGGESD